MTPAEHIRPPLPSRQDARPSVSDEAFSALVDQKLAGQTVSDPKAPPIAPQPSGRLIPRTEAQDTNASPTQKSNLEPSKPSSHQDRQPARDSHEAPDATPPSESSPSVSAKSETVEKHDDLTSQKPSPATEAKSDFVDPAVLAAASQPTPSPDPAIYANQVAFNAPVNTAPLSVSASGAEKALGDAATSSKSLTRTPTSTAPVGESLIKVAAADPTAVATDLSDAVQAIAGRATSDGDLDADAGGDTGASARKSLDLQLGAPVADALPTTPQPDAFISAPLNPPQGTSGVRAPEAPSRTVTNLSAQIIGKLGDQSTRFDVALDPSGLGRVNVSVEINAKGEMSARLSFEHPEAAAALSRESGALRQALHDAGFQMKPEDLTFQSNGGFSDRGAASQWDDGARSGGRANPFGAMTSLADAAELSAMNAAAGRTAAGGLDIRI